MTWAVNILGVDYTFDAQSEVDPFIRDTVRKLRQLGCIVTGNRRDGYHVRACRQSPASKPITIRQLGE